MLHESDVIRKKTGPIALSLEERFLRHVQKVEGQCWEWTASRYPKGYGKFALETKRNSKNRTGYAHRVAWEIFNGPIPDGLNVCHQCDNPGCVNPAHLFLGTQHENVWDCKRKGRARYAIGPRESIQGQRHPCSKLTDQQAAAIIADARPYVTIGRQYGVSASTICAIKLGKIWRHLGPRATAVNMLVAA